jgi:type II secretory pathway pseudopilin PulG
MVYVRLLRQHLKIPHDQSGLTLMELMVVVLVITTLSILGFVAYTNYDNTQRLKQAALSLKNNLRLAQVSATAARVPTTCATGDFKGYQVSFTVGSPSFYTISPICPLTVPPPTGQSYKLTPDITYDGGAPGSFIFNVLTGSTDQPVDVKITLDGVGTSQYQVKVTPAGDISATLMHI